MPLVVTWHYRSTEILVAFNLHEGLLLQVLQDSRQRHLLRDVRFAELENPRRSYGCGGSEPLIFPAQRQAGTQFADDALIVQLRLSIQHCRMIVNVRVSILNDQQRLNCISPIPQVIAVIRRLVFPRQEELLTCRADQRLKASLKIIAFEVG